MTHLRLVELSATYVHESACRQPWQVMVKLRSSWSHQRGYWLHPLRWKLSSTWTSLPYNTVKSWDGVLLFLPELDSEVLSLSLQFVMFLTCITCQIESLLDSFFNMVFMLLLLFIRFTMSTAQLEIASRGLSDLLSCECSECGLLWLLVLVFHERIYLLLSILVKYG